MKVLKCLMLVLLLSLDYVYAKEPPIEAETALLKAIQAINALNYQGTVAFLRNGKLETMRYSHAVNKGLRQERLVSLNSPLREIVRDAEKVICIFKATQQVLVDHRPFERSFLVDLPESLPDLEAGYEFSLLGEQDVAMLPAYVVALQPKDEFRYTRKIWIDKQHFLPLKVEVYDIAGTTLEQFVFTELEVGAAIPLVDVKAATKGAASKHIHQLDPQSSEQAAFSLGTLPPGFKEVFFARMPVHNSSEPIDHLLLSDGIASVSVYMENKNPLLQPGLQSVGAINSFSRIVDGSELTVMGEVPAKTVEFIAEGIKLKNASR